MKIKNEPNIYLQCEAVRCDIDRLLDKHDDIQDVAVYAAMVLLEMISHDYGEDAVHQLMERTLNAGDDASHQSVEATQPAGGGAVPKLRLV